MKTILTLLLATTITAAAQIGRYQIITTQIHGENGHPKPITLKIDTATGDTWEYRITRLTTPHGTITHAHWTPINHQPPGQTFIADTEKLSPTQTQQTAEQFLDAK